ncbi:MAG: ATP-dependent Clp protease ATP-binding subunit [Deltaproteobacteria bacterium]|nr:ATP-dependent Clp protease ATP-binding subunit [Deltaproteobacteria bacterium]
MIDFDPAYQRIITEAHDISEKVGQSTTSVHLLLALFVTDNTAGTYLLSKKIDEDKILNVVQAGQKEPDGIVQQIEERAIEYAKQTRSHDVNPMHLLLAMCRTTESLAHRLLQNSGVRVDQIRNNIFACVTGRLRAAFPGPRRENAAAPHAVRPQPTAGGRPPGAAAPVRARPDEIPRDRLPPAVITAERLEERGEPAEVAAETARVAFEIKESDFPLLCKLGRNITALAAEGKIDTLVGRQKELGEIIDVLGKRRTNNPILVGEPGVGKTALVEGLAAIITQSPQIVPGLSGKAIIELDMGRIMGGTQLRGALAERLNGIKDEVRKADGRIVVFLDEIHQLAAGGGEGTEDAANGMKSALARGEFPCIGATTSDEYTRFLESDPAFERRFQMVLVTEPDFEETVAILHGIIPEYERHHAVTYTPESLRAAATLSSRYIGDRFLPDKAISIVDLAGSRSRREGREVVTEIEIAKVVSQLARIPVEKLLMTDRERFLKMEEILGAAIVGHEDALRRVAAVIRRNYAGFGARRPIGSFLLLGPTGVGKTETVKALADFLFQSCDAMVRLDMSEYSEQHAVARLIGAPPGYVGFDAGGMLTEAVRKRPFIVVLLDEVEKAHRDVLQVFLQVLDDGRLTDGRGRTVDFSNTVVIMTSNLGNREFGARPAARIGFGAEGPDAAASAAADVEQRVFDAAREHFPPEMWNRIDEKILFHPLSREEIVRIAAIQLDASSECLRREKEISFSVEPGAVEYLIENGGFEPELGARPMRQAIQRLVEARIAELILKSDLARGDKVRIGRGAGGLEFVRE